MGAGTPVSGTPHRGKESQGPMGNTAGNLEDFEEMQDLVQDLLTLA